MAKRTKQSFILWPGQHHIVQSLMRFLNERNKAVPWEVVVREYKEDRSLEQNRTLWMWHSEFAVQHGCTKERSHNIFKYRHVLPILLRDDEDGQLTRVWELVRGDKEAVAGLVKAIHSSDLTVSQMSEAMTEYRMQAAVMGYVFTDPDEMRMSA